MQITTFYDKNIIQFTEMEIITTNTENIIHPIIIYLLYVPTKPHDGISIAIGII